MSIRQMKLWLLLHDLSFERRSNYASPSIGLSPHLEIDRFFFSCKKKKIAVRQLDEMPVDVAMINTIYFDYDSGNEKIDETKAVLLMGQHVK